MFSSESWDIPVILPDMAPPEEHVCNDFVYIIRDNCARIVGYRGKQESVRIPEKLDGLRVDSIDGGAFMGNTWMKEVSVPGCVRRICNYAFCRCRRLEMVVIREGVESIGYDAFQGCWRLELISAPSTIRSVGADAFVDTPILHVSGFPGTAVQEYCDQHGISFIPAENDE